MSSVLDTIVAGARQSADARMRVLPLAHMERLAAVRQPRGRSFREALGAPGIRVIAECKRRSPSKGVLRPDYDPAAIAVGYTSAGATAVSVLTEPSFFDGSLDHLRAVRDVTRTPLLRKDFVVTEYQIAEARAFGADAVLLIVAALTAADLARLAAYADALGLMTLVEAHADDELAVAVDAGAEVIGVNSRDLRTLAVDTTLFERAINCIPDHVIAVAESGIRTPADIRQLRSVGFDAFLIGERFMTAPDPGMALSAFLRECDPSEAS